MFDMIKDFIINWFLGGKLKEFYKALEGYKTFSGILWLVFATSLAASGADSGFLHVLFEQFSNVYNQQPLTEAEVNMLAAELWTVWGLLKKAWKGITGQPQVPGEGESG